MVVAIIFDRYLSITLSQTFISCVILKVYLVTAYELQCLTISLKKKWSYKTCETGIHYFDRQYLKELAVEYE